ncbi:YhdP family protein [Ramlibacter sp. MAHUQ-53]|uniref:YhdP family protein n=1 Tax=unclassified Ramlibacter TaxID=2617605 RepID=UPI00362B5E1B
MNDPLPPSRLFRALCAVASGAWWALLAFWLLLVLAWGGLHGWIVPRIGELRPQLEIQASRALGIPVRVGSVTAHSDSLMPSIELRDVVLLDAQKREALRLARVVVAVSPRSLWNLGFEQLYVEGPEVDVRRSADGRLWVAGLDVSQGGGDDRVVDWFFRQKEAVVLGGTVRWTDEKRQAPTLALSDVQFVVRNGPRSHALRLDATPPADWGQRFSLRAQMRQPLLSTHPGRWQSWSGQLFADFPGVDLSQLRRQADLGIDLRGGRGMLRAWVDVEAGRPMGGAADVSLQQVDAVLGAGRPPLALASLGGRLSGKWLKEGFEFETQGLQFETADGQRWPGGNVAVSWRAAQGREPEQGQVRADKLDLGALGRIASHLPLDAGTHALLTAHGPRGLVDQLQASWQGPPEQLQRYQAKGRLAGFALPAHAATGRPGIAGATLDFDFTEAGGKGRLQVANGLVDLPGVLEQPQVPLDQLSADLQWQQSGGRLSVSATQLRLANADVQAEGQASWRTGDGAARYPGVLDLTLALPRADGTRVWRYLPLGVPKETRDYVREAVQAGRAEAGKVRVRGDLRDFPFTDPRRGDFRISARVRDVTYAYVPRANPRAPQPWAPLTGLSGELVFERNAMFIKGAQGGFAGAPGLQVRADATIPRLDATVVGITGQVRGPLAEQLQVFSATPVSADIGHPMARAAASGPAELRLRLSLPVATIDRSTVQGTVTLAGNDLLVAPGVPQLTRARGNVTFNERGFSLAGVQARALGGDVRVEGGTRARAAPGEAASVIRAQGTATADGLRQARELGPVARIARNATGAAAYAVTLGLRPAGVDILVTSSLQGLGLALPAPLAKAPEAALPLRFEIVNAANRPQDQLSLELGRQLVATYVRDTSGPEPVAVRGALGVGLAPGEVAALPDQGVGANINLGSANVDAWEQVLGGPAQAAAPARGPGPGGGANAGAAAATAAAQSYLPTTLALRARELVVAGRTLNNLVAGGAREGQTWRANVDATQLSGYLEYREPVGATAGRVMARLARLSLGASAAGAVESLLDEQPASIPALDVVVEDFELRGKKLGRLEIDAVNRAAGAGSVAEWRLNRLAMTMPEAGFTATGNWAAVTAPAPRARGPERRRTVMNFRLEVADAGGLLGRLGMKDLVRRGRGRFEGQVAWAGSPLSLDYPSMSGSFAVNVESGQFLKADPGLAKLLGVLSLQALPRRLTLDFRDVFSEGFAFDFVRGDIRIDQGIASTNNLQMKGVNAAVLMEGRADLARETQELKVVVVPEINAGTASLVASVINPAVGLGSFLAQLVLREPLIRANTQEFQVDGTWTEPRVTRIERAASSPSASPSN